MNDIWQGKWVGLTIGFGCTFLALVVVLLLILKGTGVPANEIIMGIVAGGIGYGLFIKKIKDIKYYDWGQILINISILIISWGAFIVITGTAPKTFMPEDRGRGIWITISGLLILLVGLILRILGKNNKSAT